MSKRLQLIVGLLVVLSASQLNATVLITAVGLDTTTTNNWRETSTIKPLDGDHNDVYGTLGYYMFAPENHNEFSGGMFTGYDYKGGVLTTNVGGSLALSDPGGHAHYSGAYAKIDNPTLVPGPSVTDTNSGFAFVATTSPGFYTLLNVTVGANMPANFRIGLMDNGNNGDNAAFAIYTPTSTNSIALGPDNDPVYPVRYAFFDITGASLGDTFSIAVSSTTGVTVGNALGISAISVDIITIPEPSAAMLLGVGGLVLWRRRSLKS